MSRLATYFCLVDKPMSTYLYNILKFKSAPGVVYKHMKDEQLKVTATPLLSVWVYDKTSIYTF
jgi:hypothetical protein